MTADPVSIRELNPLARGERAWVYATWLRDLRDADPSGLPDDLWFSAHRDFLDELFTDRSVLKLVACATDDPNDLLGYAIARPGEELLWCHVRKIFRGRGIARLLLTEARVTPDLPARFRTRLGTARLGNPWRPRELRQADRARRRPPAP